MINNAMSSVGMLKASLHPNESYKLSNISNLGLETEKQRLNLLVGLIQKRKKIRDEVVGKLDGLIMYCDNRILDIGDEHVIKGDLFRQQAAALWQKKIVELEEQKISEQKELFKDTLFLRNEWVKSLLTFSEQQSLDNMLKTMVPSNEKDKE